ncbi:MAG: transporter [Phycisphaerales bacterium]|nr:transporter [Phycisphaerales bacterium]
MARDDTTTPLLQAINVHRHLGWGETHVHVLRGVDLTIRHGDYVSIVGQSGSGKSTLLYLLGGLDRPSVQEEDGQAVDPRPRVLIDGNDTAEMSDLALANLRNEKVGFVFQFHYLLNEFTAQENVALPIFRLGRLKKKDAMDRAAELLAELGLSEKIRRRTNKLSGGEQQRVAIARAMANRPDVLLADEPTGNLDRKNGETVAAVFESLAAGGQTIVLVTHDSQLAKRAARQITMEDGLVIADHAG